jgi:hypothetical protein
MPCGNDDPRLPGDAKRIVMPSRGVEYDLVNGEVSYADGGMTGAAAAEVLRSLRRGWGKIPDYSRRDRNFVDFPHETTVWPRKR